MNEVNQLRTLMEAVGDGGEVIAAMQKAAANHADSVGETWPYISGSIDDSAAQQIVAAKQQGASDEQLTDVIADALYDGFSGDDGEQHSNFDAFVEDATDEILWVLDKYMPGPAARQAPRV